MKNNNFFGNKRYLYCYLFLFTVIFFLFLAFFTILGKIIFTEPAKPVLTTNNVKQHVLEDKNKKPAPVKTKKQIALTFDDGPGKDTAEILDILKVYNVKATFFVLGVQAKKGSNMIRREVEEGHVIANHTYDHKNLRNLSNEGVKKEILQTERVLENQNVKIAKLLRPPGGNHNATTDKIINKLGYKLVLWTVDTRDWASLNSDMIFNVVKKNARDKSIVLMHDGGGDRRSTVKALPRIIEYLRKEGYEFVTL